MRKVIASFLILFSFLCFCLPAQAAPLPVSDPAVESSPAETEPCLIRITEIMIKNHATLRDEDGDFPDWIELHNESGQDILLENWSLSDKESRAGLVFPNFLFPADAYCLIYASGKDRPEALHAPFSLSAGETVFLRDPSGAVVSSVFCEDLKADRSLALKADGDYHECLYPTPGAENTTAAYDAWQDQLRTDGSLILNEVMVSDPNARFSPYHGSDWVELRNNTSGSIDLNGWYLSDDLNNLRQAALPAATVASGAVIVVRCDQLGFSLNSDNEALYLSEKGELRDCLYLRDIPYGGSFGRMPGLNGCFFFSEATPNKENAGGKRRVSAIPEALTADGIFTGSDPVLLDLRAEGNIYYTYDSTVPTASSLAWAGVTKIPATCVIRAVAIENNALPSRPLTLNYFINEDYALPIASLVIDNKSAFWGMYNTAWKDLEWPGSISFYEESGSFTIPCGISLHGDTSLILPKKGMALNFRGVYGQETLNYDLFQGGVSSFGNLVLRAGQDQTSAMIRNEVCENLAMAASDHIIGARSRFCVLYLDGEYYGLYALTEKFNEQHYANIAGVSKKSVSVIKAEARRDSEIYLDVFQFCATHDMSQDENYQTFLSRMDVDSLIDWVFLEGYFANTDLTYGNLRFCKSTENDGLWRFMFYDLDAALTQPLLNHGILLRRNNIQSVQVSNLFADLMNNPEFKDRFLRRSAELLYGPLAEEKVVAEIDRLADQIRPEVARDLARHNRNISSWEHSLETLRTFVTVNDWTQHNIDSICRELNLTEEERQKYFG